MLNEVIKEINNYFLEYSNGVLSNSYTVDSTFTATGTIEGDFTDTFIAGEYILIQGTRLNDGIYLISAIDDTSITIDADLDIVLSTEAEVETTLTKLYIPKSLIALIAEIKTFNSSTTAGISSESQGSRSISYENGSSTWTSAFSGRLSAYKKLKW